MRPSAARRRGVVARGGDDDLVAAAADGQCGGADAVAEPRLDVARELHAAAVEELGTTSALRVGRPDDLRERRLSVGLLLAVAARGPPPAYSGAEAGRPRPGPIRCPRSRRLGAAGDRRSGGEHEAGDERDGRRREGRRTVRRHRRRIVASSACGRDTADSREPGGRSRAAEPALTDAPPRRPTRERTPRRTEPHSACNRACRRARPQAPCALAPRPPAAVSHRAIPDGHGVFRAAPRQTENGRWEKMCRMGCYVGGCGVEVSAADRGGGAPPTPPPRSASTSSPGSPEPIQRPRAHLATRGTRDDRWPSAAPSTTRSTPRTGSRSRRSSGPRSPRASSSRRAIERCVAVWIPKRPTTALRGRGARGLNPLSPQARELKRVLHGERASTPSSTRAGRVMLPPAPARARGHRPEVVVTGAGDCLELWDRAAWAAYDARPRRASVPTSPQRLGHPA